MDSEEQCCECGDPVYHLCEECGDDECCGVEPCCPVIERDEDPDIIRALVRCGACVRALRWARNQELQGSFEEQAQELWNRCKGVWRLWLQNKARPERGSDSVTLEDVVARLKGYL